SVVRVHPGDVAVVSWRGGGTPDLRAPGLSLRLPILQRVQIYPRGAITVRETLAAASREGSALDIPYTVKAQPDPQILLQLQRDAIYGRRVETGSRVVLVGIDGADWDVIDGLVARGRVPNLARLKREGAWARLRSSVPMLSPLLWTTVATGKTPDRHGINDF